MAISDLIGMFLHYLYGEFWADSYSLLSYGVEGWNELELRCGSFPLYYQ